jgi:hypothetical protein
MGGHIPSSHFLAILTGAAKLGAVWHFSIEWWKINERDMANRSIILNEDFDDNGRCEC